MRVRVHARVRLESMGFSWRPFMPRCVGEEEAIACVAPIAAWQRVDANGRVVVQ